MFEEQQTVAGLASQRRHSKRCNVILLSVSSCACIGSLELLIKFFLSRGENFVSALANMGMILCNFSEMILG